LEGYKLKEVIGKGCFGKVKLACIYSRVFDRWSRTPRWRNKRPKQGGYQSIWKDQVNRLNQKGNS